MVVHLLVLTAPPLFSVTLAQTQLQINMVACMQPPPARPSSPHTSFIPLDIPEIVPVVPERASVDSLSLALLSQQIPPLPKFSSEDQDGEGETFEDWKEQLELITTHVSGTTKLGWSTW